MRTSNFLDYVIKDFSQVNNDGFVIVKPGAQNYECHLGNYSTLEAAQKACVFHFMIARPHEFSATILYRMSGLGGQYHEWGKFKWVCIKEKIKIPDLLGPTVDLNSQIAYMGSYLKGI